MLLLILFLTSLFSIEHVEEADKVNGEILIKYGVLKQVGEVTTTVYRANIHECDSDFLTTASGFKLDSNDQYQHRIIALSRDLFNENINFGDSVFLFGTGCYDGWWHVEDTMNSRYFNTVDLLINEGMLINKWNNIQLYILEDG